jgi:enoyl-[acyl-carrier-protein] reductase (NADH)
MDGMAVSPPPTTAFSRRTLLAASAAGLAVLVTGCTSSSGGGQEKVTTEQADSLAEQVAVQERLVAAYAAAGSADPALRAAVTVLAQQAGEQLDRLKAASPGRGSASTAPASGSVAKPGPDPRAWLRQQVAEAARSHATACVAQTGARAALLGSIAAGLRGQAGRLA